MYSTIAPYLCLSIGFTGAPALALQSASPRVSDEEIEYESLIDDAAACSCKLQVTSCKLRVASCELRVTRYELQGARR